MKTIQINHIGKTEGHLSFVGALVDGDFAEARIETEEGSRLIEGILMNRKYFEAPIVTSRICGVCPIVHNLTSIKALEQALNIKVNKEIILLRKLLMHAQWIHSHALHAFFLSFPDIVGISNNFDFIKKYPKECALALAVRDFGVELARIIGGRTVHPINSVIGGFNIEPSFTELTELMKKLPEVIAKANKLFKFVTRKQLPKFENPSNYVCLKTNEYPIYDGLIYFSDNKKTATADKFLYDIQEHVLPNEAVKRVTHINQPIMLGSIARVNNCFSLLSPGARAAWAGLKVELPCYNPFYNIFAQVVEIIHSLETVGELFIQYDHLRDNDTRYKIEFKPNPGKGYAVMEAPRGLLYHQYELDKRGNIVYCNIIPPTTMFLTKLEQDLAAFLPSTAKMNDKKREHLIRTLIRSYDPCISCATH